MEETTKGGEYRDARVSRVLLPRRPAFRFSKLRIRLFRTFPVLIFCFIYFYYYIDYCNYLMWKFVRNVDSLILFCQRLLIVF